MSKIKEVLRLKYFNLLSNRQIQTITGVSRNSVANYVNSFNVMNLSLEKILELNDEEIEQFFHPKKPLISNSLTTTTVEIDWNNIHQELCKKGMTRKLLYEEIASNNPNIYSYSQFNRYYNKFVKTVNPSMRQIHYSGDKLFIDYSGLTMPIVNQRTGEISKAQIFVTVLGASGYTYVHATYSQKQRDFILSHTLAYDFFGGTPLIVVPDNLKSAIIKNNKKDGIVINESYAALARHYNMAVSPARPYKPKDKSKAEQGVQGIQRWILASLRHQTFFSVDELNDAISLLLDKYNNKIVKRFNKSRFEMFLELDKPFLQSLPNERYIYKEFKEATVSQSYHIFLEGCEYSVPYKYLGFKVFVAYSNQSVSIYYKGIQIALHPKLHFSGQTSTLSEHMPLNHQYANEKINPGKYLNWAKDIGIFTLQWVKKEFEEVTHAPNAYRKLNAVLSMAKIYGKKELNLALEYAVDNQITATASIKSILDKKLYMQKPANNSATSINIFNNHEYLRGNIYQ